MTGGADYTEPVGVNAMSEIPVRAAESSKSLWPAAAFILTIVFAPAAIACAFMLLRN